MTQFTTIVLPTRPQVDTISAIFLLKKFATEQFPGIADATIAVWTVMPEGETEDTLALKGTVLLDIGGGKFDHHGKEQTTATDLVANFLGMGQNPALQNLPRLFAAMIFMAKVLFRTMH